MCKSHVFKNYKIIFYFSNILFFTSNQGQWNISIFYTYFTLQYYYPLHVMPLMQTLQSFKSRSVCFLIFEVKRDSQGEVFKQLHLRKIISTLLILCPRWSELAFKSCLAQLLWLSLVGHVAWYFTIFLR